LFALPKLSGPNNTRLTKERYHATVETREGMVEELRVSKPREKREERKVVSTTLSWRTGIVVVGEVRVWRF